MKFKIYNGEKHDECAQLGELTNIVKVLQNPERFKKCYLQ